MQAQRESNLKSGFTLLEVILAMAMLIIGLTAVLHTTTSALQRMQLAKELTEAQNACQALLHELLAQSAPIQSREDVSIDQLPDWQIRLDIYPAPQSGLYVLHLSVVHRLETHSSVKYQLVRWVPEERVLVSALPDAAAIEESGVNVFEDMFQ